MRVVLKCCMHAVFSVLYDFFFPLKKSESKRVLLDVSILLIFACCIRDLLLWNLWNFVVYIFCVWSALWYCEILCYIFLRLERALVLCNFVLYFSACGTRSGIVEFCVIFFCVPVERALVL